MGGIPSRGRGVILLSHPPRKSIDFGTQKVSEFGAGGFPSPSPNMLETATHGTTVKPESGAHPTFGAAPGLPRSISELQPFHTDSRARSGGNPAGSRCIRCSRSGGSPIATSRPTTQHRQRRWTTLFGRETLFVVAAGRAAPQPLLPPQPGQGLPGVNLACTGVVFCAGRGFPIADAFCL